MGKRLGILHLSDIHASAKSQNKLQHLVECLCNDLGSLIKLKNIDIQAVCITGDFINSGDLSDTELEIVFDSFVQPLMGTLYLDKSKIFVVPGNHEIKQSKVIQYIECGLEATLRSEDTIENFISAIGTGNDESINRISYFDKNFSTLFGGTPIYSTPLTRAYMFSAGDLTIGIACVNSSWRSTGIGSTEKGKMIIGRSQIIGSFEKIKSADITICMMHHPLDWLTDEDKTAVEKCISKFDIILNGHIHESDTKIYTSFNGQTLFNTCGKFDNYSDIYNGYTLLSIDPYSKDCDVILRQYFDFPRDCFDSAVCVAPNGIFSASLAKKDDKLALAYNIVHAVKPSFLDFANSYFVSNIVAGSIQRSFDDAFIIPEFSWYSEYEKETNFDQNLDAEEEVVNLETICNNKKNYLILGKKEIGKTTILHYIAKYCLSNFNVLKEVPIIIDIAHTDFSGKNPILRAAQKFLSEYCDIAKSFSISEIESLFQSGLCTIMFDNFESANPKHLSKINNFLGLYPCNKYIFAEREEVGARSLRAVPVVPECPHSKIHICSLSRSQIRAIATANKVSEDSSSLVDKIMLSFKSTALPKTPFVLSLILSLCTSSDFSPINEAVIMEQFMDFLLEKASPLEASSSTFDFHDKEDFLIYLVLHMDKNNKFYLTDSEFEMFLQEYHDGIGFTVRETGFNTLFFDNGILVHTQNTVTFRYSCIIEYYLAKKAMQSPSFLQHILSDKNYLNYPETLLYYTGLNRRDLTVVTKLQAELYKYFENLKSVVDELKEYNIGMNFSLPPDTFTQRLSENKLTQSQSDAAQDIRDMSEVNLPENIDKQMEFGELDAFIQTLLIYGSSLKNLELISKEEKIHRYSDYTFGLCLMLGILKQSTEDSFASEISDMEQLPDKYSQDDISKSKSLFQDLIKITLPIAIGNIALENIGTAKFKSILEDAIAKADNSDFTQFFNVFLYVDLRLPGLQKVLNDYITQAKDKSLLKIIFFKLMYYYYLGYFSPSLNPYLENALADINIKLGNGNNYNKSNMIQSLKKHKKFPNM